MLAIRSGIPLALQGRKRRRGTRDFSPSGPTARKRNSTGGSKKGDLGVRKDLTLPTAPTAEEVNVFQSEDSTPNATGKDNHDPNVQAIPVDPIFTGCELSVVHSEIAREIVVSAEDILTSSGDVDHADPIGQDHFILEDDTREDEDDIAADDKDEKRRKTAVVNCIECEMEFATQGQLRLHVK